MYICHTVLYVTPYDVIPYSCACYMPYNVIRQSLTDIESSKYKYVRVYVIAIICHDVCHILYFYILYLWCHSLIIIMTYVRQTVSAVYMAFAVICYAICHTIQLCL